MSQEHEKWPVAPAPSATEKAWNQIAEIATRRLCDAIDNWQREWSGRA